MRLSKNWRKISKRNNLHNTHSLLILIYFKIYGLLINFILASFAKEFIVLDG